MSTTPDRQVDTPDCPSASSTTTTTTTMPTIDSKTVAGTATSPPLTSPPGATTAPPKSAIGIFTATTVAPRAILTTVLRTLKVIAKPVTAAVRATRRRDPTQSRGAALMHEARLAIPEELDEWQEVDGEDVKEDMRVDWLRLRWEKERAEKLAAGIAVDENDEPQPRVYTRKRKVRRVDDEEESEGEVIEIS